MGGFPRSSVVKNPPAKQRCGFDPWVGKIPCRRRWQPTPVFLPGKSHVQAVHGVEKSQRHNLAPKQQRVQGGLPGNAGWSRTVMIQTRPSMKGTDPPVVETEQWNLLWWRGKGRLQNNTEMWTWVNKRTQSMQLIVHILEESTCSNLSYFWFSRVNLQSWRQWYSKLSPSGNMAFTQGQMLHSVILTLFH